MLENKIKKTTVNFPIHSGGIHYQRYLSLTVKTYECFQCVARWLQVEGRRRFMYETVAMENLKILSYITNCLLLSRITLSENIDHNNALIGIFAESNLMPTIQSKLTNSSNQSHLYVLKSFQKELGLNDLMKKALFLRNNSNHLQGIVSFLDHIESAILQDIDVNGKKSFMSFNAHHCNLVSICFKTLSYIPRM